MTHDYSEYKDEDSGPGENLMARIEGLAKDQIAAASYVASLEEQLSDAKAALRNITEKTLPDLLDEAQLGESTITTPAGYIVKMAEVIRGSIPKGKEEPAFAWLEANDNGGLIKRTITIDFGKGEDKWADKFERDCAKRKKPLNIKRKKAVNAQSLQAFVRTQLAEGIAIPMNVFGVFRQRFVKVTVTVKAG